MRDEGYNQEQRFEAAVAALALELESQGILWQSFADARRKNPELIEARLGTLAKDQSLPDVDSGRLIYVPKGVQCPFPLLTFGLHWLESQRLLVIAEADSYLELVTGCVSQKNFGLANLWGVSEVFVGRGAEVRHLTLKNFSEPVDDGAAEFIKVDSKGRFLRVDFNLGQGSKLLHPKFVRAADCGDIACHHVDLKTYQGESQALAELADVFPLEYAVEIKAKI